MLGEKIKQRRKELGFSQEYLANLLGYQSRSSIQKIEKGENDIPQSKIVQFAKALHTTPAYLMGWEDKKSTAGQATNPTSHTKEPNFESVQLIEFPIIGNIAAGYDNLAIEEYTGEMELIPISELRGRSPRDYFVLRVSGNSMYPQMLDGDKVLVQRCASVDIGSTAVVLYDGENATVKKVNYINGSNWLELIPANPEFMTRRIEGVDLEQCRVLGKVVKLIRDF